MNAASSSPSIRATRLAQLVHLAAAGISRSAGDAAAAIEPANPTNRVTAGRMARTNRMDIIACEQRVREKEAQRVGPCAPYLFSAPNAPAMSVAPMLASNLPATPVGSAVLFAP